MQNGLKFWAILVILTLTMAFPSFTWASYNGSSTDVMLQGFNWTSWALSTDWYTTLNNLASPIGSLFTVIWLPPPSQAASDQGYLPTDWYTLNTNYGTQSELKTLINSLHNNNVKVLADIVINHRSAHSQCPHGVWCIYDFGTNNGAGDMTPSVNLIDGHYDQISNGVYTCQTCCNSGCTEGTWSYGGRTYSCFDYTSAPDLNHWYSDTRIKITNWLTWLMSSSNAGFDGWRYDTIRGFDPAYLNTYNDATNPYISVAEWWDSNNSRQTLCDVINQSGNKTMCFDYTTKANLNTAFASNTFRGDALATTGTNTEYGLIGWWPDYAVTFVENHDTGWSPTVTHNGITYTGQNEWYLPLPCNGDFISLKCAYAYILTHPGIPCVYWSDWYDRDSDTKTAIETLIKIRRSNGITKTSSVTVAAAQQYLYAAYIGSNVAIKIGNQGQSVYENWYPGSSYTYAFTRYYTGGHAFCVYYKNVAQ